MSNWLGLGAKWAVSVKKGVGSAILRFLRTANTPVPRDYDGDGRNDAGVFRSSNNTWFINRTTAGTLIQQFGATGDLPLPSAYVR